jgi:ribonuclease H2 subunit B
MNGSMKVLLLEKDEVLNVGTSPYLPLVSYMHPKGSPVLYLNLGDTIYELQMVQPKGRYASWFIDDRVSSDENFYIASKIDPKFLLLPYLEKNAKKFSPIDQLLTFENDCHRLPVKNDKIKEWKIDLI